MNFKAVCFVLILIICVGVGNGQNSFQRVVSDSIGLTMLDAAPGRLNEILLVSWYKPVGEKKTYMVSRLDDLGTPISSTAVKFDSVSVGGGLIDYLVRMEWGNYLLFFEINANLLVSVVTEDGQVTDSRLYNDLHRYRGTGQEMISDGEGGSFLVGVTNFDRSLELIRFDANGRVVLRNKYFTNFEIPTYGYAANIVLNKGHIFLSRGVTNSISQQGGVIAKLSLDGEAQKSILISNIYLNSLASDDLGNIYALSDDMIIKFDENLSLLWSKKLVFGYDRPTGGVHSRIMVNERNELFVSIRGVGAGNPKGLRLLRLDDTGQLISGNILRQDDRAHFTSLDLVNNGVLNLTSSNLDKSILQKFNLDGLIEGCRSESLCIEVVDTSIVFTNIDVEQTVCTIPSGDLIDFTLSDVEMNLEDYCHPLVNPSGYFELEEYTICKNETVKIVPQSIYPLGYSEWIIKRGNDIVYRCGGVPPTEYVFTASGTYTVIHQLWITNCLYADSVHLNVEENMPRVLDDSLLICDDEILEVDMVGDSVISLIRDEHYTISEFRVSEAGNYSLVYITANGCQQEESFVVQRKNTPMVDLGPDTILCNLEEIILSIEEYKDVNVRWTDGSTNSSIRIKYPGTYGVRVENECGSSYDETVIQLEDCTFNYFVPSAFSPNGDNINDELQVFSAGITLRSLSIYSRWGELVFKIEGADLSWNGRSVDNKLFPKGTYAYVLEYYDEYGSAKLASGAFVLL